MSKNSATLNTLFAHTLTLHQTGQLKAAARNYQKLLKNFPTHPQLLSGLGNIALQNGHFAQAVQKLEKSLTVDPLQPGVLSNLGIAFARLNRLDQAVSCYRRAIALKPDFADAHFNLAHTLAELQQFPAALESYDNTLRFKPTLAEAYYNRGFIQQHLQQLDAAITSYDQAIKLNPNYVQAYNNHGIVLQTLKYFDAALLSFEKVIALQPDFAEAHYNMGNCLQQLHRLDEALSYYKQAIILAPDLAAAHNNLGLTLQALRQYRLAQASFERALVLNPKYPEAFNNLGSIMQAKNCYTEALANYTSAIALKPDYAQAFNNRGKVWQDTQQFSMAETDFRHAIALQADYAGAYWNLALLKLMTGCFVEGWRLFEWRWRDQQQAQARSFSQPLWLGEQAVANKVVLIHPEQGFGDFIQFCRYAILLETLGAQVIIETPVGLKTLLASLPGRFTLVEQDQPLPDFDLHCPVMSLPLAFKTTLDTIPANTPYLFADKQKQKIWQARLGPKTRFRIGLTWSGSIFQQNDHNRSMPLKFLAPLLSLPLEFHCLQNELRPNDAMQLSDYPELKTHLADIIDFTDTAALISEMDLVISVCTANAHLAGALGKPVWILLPHVACYRWLQNRTDSPWYPTATLLRQAEPGNWSALVAELVHKLSNVFIAGKTNV